VNHDQKSALIDHLDYAVLNYLYCDVLSFMDSGLLKQYLTGRVNGMTVSQEFLLAAGFLMEISISMVLSSRILPHQINRWTNVVAGTITTLAQVTSLFVGPTGYYLFFSALEIAATTSVVVLAGLDGLTLGASGTAIRLGEHAFGKFFLVFKNSRGARAITGVLKEVAEGSGEIATIFREEMSDVIRIRFCRRPEQPHNGGRHDQTQTLHSRIQTLRRS
jgi:Family of unknown function (DUF6326)